MYIEIERDRQTQTEAGWGNGYNDDNHGYRDYGTYSDNNADDGGDSNDKDDNADSDDKNDDADSGGTGDNDGDSADDDRQAMHIGFRQIGAFRTTDRKLETPIKVRMVGIATRAHHSTQCT